MKVCKLQVFSWILRVAILGFIIHSVLRGVLPYTIFLIVVFGISLLPVFRKRTCPGVDIICVLDMLLLLIIVFNSIGVIEGYTIPFYDEALHFLGGILLAGIIFSALFFLDSYFEKRYEQIRAQCEKYLCLESFICSLNEHKAILK